MATTLTVGATTYGFTPPVTHDFWIDEWGWDLDSDQGFQFHEIPRGTQPTYAAGTFASVKDGATVRAAGEIVSVSPVFGDEGWVFGYRVRGYKYLTNKIPVTAIDGTGVIRFNLPADDDDYLPSFAGQSVGQIISYVLTQHATQLTAIGVTTDATTTAQLAALTLVPSDPVTVAGERLANAIDSVLSLWARNVVFVITAAGLVRFLDTTALSDLTLTEGTDPIEPVRFSRDISDCATRVQVRGGANVAVGFVRQSKLTITPAWTTTQKNAWTLNDFLKPNDAFDSGTIAAGNILGPTSIRVQSSNGSATWTTNFWPGRQAWIHLHSSVGSALTFTESRPITANTALAAGGTSDITVGYPLENAGSSAYDSYEIIGTYAPLGSGGFDRNNVYRLFNITDPGGQIANHLMKKFPVEQPFVSYTGDATAKTLYPIAVVVKGGQTFPVTFKVLPATGQILFDEPVVKVFNSTSVLTTGGASVVYPDDVYVMLAYSRGALTATYPADIAGVPQYAGTAKTGPENLQRTAPIDLDSWIYAGNTAQVQQYAQMMHQSMSDTVLTGTVQYRGAYAAAYEPGVRLSIAGTGYTTGLETAKVPIRSFTLRFNKTGTPQLFTSSLSCSSRRNPATGDRQFTHLTSASQVGFKFDFGAGFSDSQMAMIAAAGKTPLSSGDVGQLAALPGSLAGSDPTAVGSPDLTALAGSSSSLANASDPRRLM